MRARTWQTLRHPVAHGRDALATWFGRVAAANVDPKPADLRVYVGPTSRPTTHRHRDSVHGYVYTNRDTGSVMAYLPPDPVTSSASEPRQLAHVLGVLGDPLHVEARCWCECSTCGGSNQPRSEERPR